MSRQAKWIISVIIILSTITCANSCCNKKPNDDNYTYGSIFVDRPEVFKRERFVLRRIETREWIEGKIKAIKRPDYQPGFTALMDIKILDSLISRLSANLDPFLSSPESRAQQYSLRGMDRTEQLAEIDQQITLLNKLKELREAHQKLLSLDESIVSAAQTVNPVRGTQEDNQPSTANDDKGGAKPSGGNEPAPTKDEKPVEKKVFESYIELWQQFLEKNIIEKGQLKFPEYDTYKEQKSILDMLYAELGEVELDDTHDIMGSTLYTLKYDITLLPEIHANYTAVVTMNVNKPNEISEHTIVKFLEAVKYDLVKEYKNDIPKYIVDYYNDTLRRLLQLDSNVSILRQDNANIIDIDYECINIIDRKKLSGSADAYYIYAVEPKEFNENILLHGSTFKLREYMASIGLLLLPGYDINSYVQNTQQIKEEMESVIKNPMIVGYLDNKSFGWIFGPSFNADTKGGYNIIQRRVQRSVQASIVVPVFWDNVTINTSWYWIDDNGSIIRASNDGGSSIVKVDLPVDKMALASYFKQYRGDISGEPMPDWRNLSAPWSVRVGERAQFYLPGKDLWRNPQVYLGGQRADSVLPTSDMQGIQITFNTIDKCLLYDELESAWVNMVVVTSFGKSEMKEQILVRAKNQNDDFETAYTKSFDSNRNSIDPATLENRYLVTEGRSADIVIFFGKREWARPQVFIGMQAADEVKPLNDGKGVIARFTKINEYHIKQGEKVGFSKLYIITTSGRLEQMIPIIVVKPGNINIPSQKVEVDSIMMRGNNHYYIMSLEAIAGNERINGAEIEIKPIDIHNAPTITIKSSKIINENNKYKLLFEIGDAVKWESVQICEMMVTLMVKYEKELLTYTNKVYDKKIIYFRDTTDSLPDIGNVAVSCNIDTGSGRLYLNSDIMIPIVKYELYKEAYPVLKTGSKSNMKLVFRTNGRIIGDVRLEEKDWMVETHEEESNAVIVIHKSLVNKYQKEEGGSSKWSWLNTVGKENINKMSIEMISENGAIMATRGTISIKLPAK